VSPESQTIIGTPTSAPEDEESSRQARRRRRRNLLGWAITIVVALLVATGTRAYAIQSFFVPSPSMTPTLMTGDRIMVNKLSGTIHRGDIVVFHKVPADKGGPPILVKRVVGLPGERISSVGERVYIDGKPLAEPWLPKLVGQCAQPAERIRATTIPAGQYFVMGDCRGDSDDSRYWGPVPGSYVIGKVDVIFWRNGHPWLHWF
jgi:signal peptidase I